MGRIGSTHWKAIHTNIIINIMNVSTKLQSGAETNMYVTKRSMPNTQQGTLLALKDFPFHVRVCLYTFCSCECIFVDMYQGHCSQKENRESSRLQPFNWLDVILASLMKIVFTTVVNWPWYSPFS